MITITTAEYNRFLAQQTEIEYLKHQLAELKRLIFGTKSERFVAPDPLQGSLFDIPVSEPAEKDQEDISYTRTKAEKSEKKQPLRAELPAHLPRKTEVIEPENVPAGSKHIGDEVTEILEYDPANIYVRRIVRPKYIVASDDESTQIVIAELPSLPIPKGNAGSSMITQILVSKYIDHNPYFRQSKTYKRQQNIYLADSTLGGWAHGSIERWIVPVYSVLREKIVQTDYLAADETPMPVLSADKPGSTHRGYYWVYYDPVRKLVCFDYRQTRGREGPRGFLKGFSGNLLSDGYGAYSDLDLDGLIVHLACWAHVRRKYEHSKDNDKKRSAEMLALIQRLYDIEREARDNKLSYDEIRVLRQEKSIAILNQIERWLEKESGQVLPKSAIGMAISYTRKLWPRLTKYIEDGRFNNDNNLVENVIRPVALGRKNYLFAGSHEAAQRGAVMYSMIATCQLRGINPAKWIKEVLDKAPDYKANRLEELLP